ncbi:MAG: roadblock/LC7 domain-containing protein [Planctomycetota bacterium]|nr:roadblock/LC7 domain-containing protein [Planctomycetota bacterium]
MGDTDQRLKSRRLVFYQDDVDKIDKALINYQTLSKSKCNILVDIEGHAVTKVGDTEGIDLETIAALVAASFAATKEVAKILGQTEFTTLTHQGKVESIQLTLIGQRTILATIFDSKTTIGMVMFYTKELVERLVVIFDEIGNRKQEIRFEEGFGNDVSDVLDDLFDD